ncbi:arginase family protein [Kocuria rhizophila]|nr:arginase family protein [Kocuria rhizophila]
MTTTRITPPDPEVWSGQDERDSPGAPALAPDEHRQGIAHEAAQQTLRMPREVTDSAAPARTLRRLRRLRRPPPSELIGFSCDEGVRRNKRAAWAPPRARTPCAVPSPFWRQLPTSAFATPAPWWSRAATWRTARTPWPPGRTPPGHGQPMVVLGGGHDTARGAACLGRRCDRLRDQRVGVLNLDAHFDLRQADEPSSGTRSCRWPARARRPAARSTTPCWGSASPTTPASCSPHGGAGRRVPSRTSRVPAPPPRRRPGGRAGRLVERVDAVRLSIDLDVLPAAVAPA